MSSWRKADVAGSYVEGVRAAIPLIDAQIDLLHRLLDGTVPSIERVVDLGCGDGALAATVLERHPNARALLVDISRPMLDRARARFGLDCEQVTLLEADLGDPGWLEVPWLERPCDLIISGYAIHHLTDERKRELFAEIWSLLRPGGVFINLEHVAPGSARSRSLFDELFIDNLHHLALASNPQSSREHIASAYHGRDDQHDNILASVELQCAWMRDVGFIDVECYFKILELAILAGRRSC